MPDVQSEARDWAVQGYHTGGLPMAMAGLVKGTLGVVIRPAVGMLELVSKGTHGMGLVCLGREAITGSAQRRVRAPGALVEEQTEVSSTLITHQPRLPSTHQPRLPSLRTLVAGALQGAVVVALTGRSRAQRGLSFAGCG